MKIISVDNFDREIIGTSDDRLIAENVSDYFANIIVEALNKRLSGDHADRYFKAVPDDYKLREYGP